MTAPVISIVSCVHCGRSGPSKTKHAWTANLESLARQSNMVWVSDDSLTPAVCQLTTFERLYTHKLARNRDQKKMEASKSTDALPSIEPHPQNMWGTVLLVPQPMQAHIVCKFFQRVATGCWCKNLSGHAEHSMLNHCVLSWMINTCPGHYEASYMGSHLQDRQ